MANQIGDTVSKGNYFNVCTDETNQTFETKSFYTDSEDVKFADGKNAENKMGAIKGITSDLNTTTTGYAADMTTVAKLNSSLNDSNTSESFNFGSLNGVRGFFTNPSRADDSFVPFSQSKKFKIGKFSGQGNHKTVTFDAKTILTNNKIDYTKVTSNNFFVGSCTAYAYIDGSNATHSTSCSLSYNNTTGILTVSGLYNSPGINRNIWLVVTVWFCL